MRFIASAVLALVAASQTAFAQTGQPLTKAPQPVEKKGILYSSSHAFGAQIYSNGWSAHLELAQIKHLHLRNFYQFEISQLRHPKEVRQSNQGFSVGGVNAPRPYIYGKQNNFYTVNAAAGQERLLGQRAKKSGVEVSFKYMAGFSLGIVKPYYLQVFTIADDGTTVNQEPTDERYSDETRFYFLQPSFIYGASGFSKGWDAPSLIPGGMAKAGLKFDWAFYEQNIKALEVGVALNVYPKRVPIMIIDKNLKAMPNVYIGIEFGKKKV